MIALDYCIARAYFRFGQLDIAKEKNNAIIAQTRGAYTKSVNLGILIDKALKGEFDVLLDDESDWLKSG